MKVMYFAWLRLRTGVGEEELALPDGVATVAELVDWLRARRPYGAGRAMPAMSTVTLVPKSARLLCRIWT